MSPQVVLTVAFQVASSAVDGSGAWSNWSGLAGGAGAVAQSSAPPDDETLDGLPDAVSLLPEPCFSQTEMPTTAPIQRTTTSATMNTVDFGVCSRLSCGLRGRLVFDMASP